MMEVCNTPTANTPTNVMNQGVMPPAYVTTVTTAQFTGAVANATAWLVRSAGSAPSRPWC